MSKKCTFESMMYIWEQNVHFVANKVLFHKFEVFLKTNVKKCTFESNDVHLWAKILFCGKFCIFSKIWSFFEKMSKKCTFESMMYIWEHDVHLRAKCSFCGKFGIVFTMLAVLFRVTATKVKVFWFICW